MINADKYKKNKFRKLIPTSSSQTDKLQKLTTAQYDKQPLRPHLTISQEMPKGSTKIGVEGVSQRYKDKHFAFQRRLRTISSMNQKHEETVKSASAIGQYQHQPERVSNKEEGKYNSLVAMIEEFKKKAEEIANSKNLQELNTIQCHAQFQVEEDNFQEKFDDLIERTKLSSLKLITIYVNRYISSIKRQALNQLSQVPSLEFKESQKIVQQPYEQQQEYVEPKTSNCRSNLLNVSKFFGST